MQTFHYHFLETNTALKNVAGQMREIFATTSEPIVHCTEEVEIDIVVRHSPQNTIPEMGISGQYTKDASCIDIFVDLNNLHLKQNFETEVARTLIHEYMHVVREQYVPWENGTLLDSLVAEGLAQSFEIEILPDVPPSMYATSCTAAELDGLWNKAKDILDQRGWANDEWFFGGETIKRWAGYSLGFSLVQNQITKGGVPSSQLYKRTSADFLAC